MFVLRLIKNPKYFYSLMALLFLLFVALIIMTGRQIYKSEQTKLFNAKTSELHITKSHFETMMDGVELELRRLVNSMKSQNLLTEPDDVKIKSFVSDFLFDHNYLRLLIVSSEQKPLINITSDSFPENHRSFVSLESTELTSKLRFDSAHVNKLLISRELNIVYMIKLLTDSVGQQDNFIIFFFAPDFLLKNLPPNYAFLVSGGMCTGFRRKAISRRISHCRRTSLNTNTYTSLTLRQFSSLL